jgi:hypothetical protein
MWGPLISAAQAVRADAPIATALNLRRLRRISSRLTMKLRGRPEASDGRRGHSEVTAADHLRLRCTMKAARMTMKTTMKGAALMCYSKPLAAPNRSRAPPNEKRLTDPSNHC